MSKRDRRRPRATVEVPLAAGRMTVSPEALGYLTPDQLVELGLDDPDLRRAMDGPTVVEPAEGP